ncbi:hypothetical protein [Natronococcus roseus]|uniref:hypothetical protein n=1 Tax=Natronococcus roseus TaxID=1052014 RepID=UPI00374CDD65
MNGINHPGLGLEGLTPVERQAVNKLDSELHSIRPQYDGLIFVLGNFGDEREDRIDDFQDAAHSWDVADYAAVRMDEFLSTSDTDLEGHSKFKVIADHADAIVPIIEDDAGGVTWEQAIIREYRRYRQKTYLMKRAYPQKDEHEIYSWMQSTSLFDRLDGTGRMYEWTIVCDFQAQIDTVLADIHY